MSTLAASLETGMKAPMLKADGANWFSWKARIELQLGRRGHLPHLRPTHIIPVDPATVQGFDWDAIQADTTLLAQYRTEERVFTNWQNDNNGVILHLVSGLPDSLTTGALRHKLAHKVWKWLGDEYERKGDAYAQTLRRTFDEKRCAPTGDVRAYVDEMEDLRLRYDAAAQEPMLESEYTRAVLSSIPDYYRKHVANIRATAEALESPPPKADALLRAVRREYDRVTLERASKPKTVKDDAEDVALHVNSNSKPTQKAKSTNKIDMSKVRCYGCGQLGHMNREKKCDAEKRKEFQAAKAAKAKSAKTDAESSSATTKAGDAEQAKRAVSPVLVYSARAQQPGVLPTHEPHDDSTTWLDGLDDDEPPSEPETTSVPLSALVAKDAVLGAASAEVVDSGASRHMSSLGSRFISLRPIPPHPIIAAEGAVFHAHAEGDYILRVPRPEGGQRDITLKKTLYAPALHGTLVSVSRIDNAKGEVRFSSGNCRIYDVNERVVGVIPQVDGLYQLQRPSDVGARAMYSYASQKRPLTWMELHRVMGHVSPAAVKAQYLRGGFKGVKVDETSEIFDCESCTVGKINAARIPKTREGERSKKYGEWWWTDMWGPAPVASAGGKLYADLYTDDAFHWHEVFFYKKKDEAEDTIIDFDMQLELQEGIRMHIWCTDQASEYGSLEKCAQGARGARKR